MPSFENRPYCTPFTPCLLSVSPDESDHLFLGERAKLIDSGPVFLRALTYPSALAAVQDRSIAVIVCDTEFSPRTWKETLEKTSILPAPPNLIVSSRLADESLWAEALNLGAYDVLAKPFDSEEVIRVLSGAWRRWKPPSEAVVSQMRARAGAQPFPELAPRCTMPSGPNAAEPTVLYRPR